MSQRESKTRSEDQPRGMARWFRQQLPLETETSFFILASALDVFMTIVLLSTGDFRESNEYANLALQRFGFRGMIAFKFLIVAAVTVIAQIVAVHRPRVARALLIGGTLVTMGVVFYSASLFAKYSQLL